MVTEGVVRGEGVEAQSTEPARHSGALHDKAIGTRTTEESVKDIVRDIGTRALLASDARVEVKLRSDLWNVDFSLLLDSL